MTPNSLNIGDVRLGTSEAANSPPIKTMLSAVASGPVAEISALDLSKSLTPMDQQHQDFPCKPTTSEDQTSLPTSIHERNNSDYLAKVQ